MSKLLLTVLSFCLAVFVVHSSYASSSISTRVKVVEDKVRVHDKKIKDIKAQQEALSRSLGNARVNHSNPVSPAPAKTLQASKSAVKEKTEAELEHERSVAAAQARKRAEAEAKAKRERLAALYRSRYAYP